jgi:hypothetical protein
MNLSLIAVLALFFGLAAASLAVRIANTDTPSEEGAETPSAKRLRAQAGLTKAS